MIQALEREIAPAGARPSKRKPVKRVKFPLIPATGGKTIDLSDFDFDDLLA
jgi:hypothetical protein